MSHNQELAERFAPVVFHANDEPNLPANVDWFLARTSLWFYDRHCDPPLKEKLIEGPSQRQLIQQTYAASCGAGEIVRSGGTRSESKWRTFFLEDVSTPDRKGCLDQGEWATYFHAYRNDNGGIIIQYWRFHAYNTGVKIDLGLDIEVGCHGGDWEGIHVVLDGDDNPLMARLLGHAGIQRLPWNAIQRDGAHPIVYSERGGHATLADEGRAGFRKTSGIEHKTWVDGGLVDLGEKTSPLSDQLFIQYSGLWGSLSELPKEIPLIHSEIVQKGFFVSSGYWGPAFNETELRGDQFITAWGEGCADENKVVNGVPEYRPTYPIA